MPWVSDKNCVWWLSLIKSCCWLFNGVSQTRVWIESLDFVEFWHSKQFRTASEVLMPIIKELLFWLCSTTSAKGVIKDGDWGYMPWCGYKIKQLFNKDFDDNFLDVVKHTTSIYQWYFFFNVSDSGKIWLLILSSKQGPLWLDVC